jgi:dihydropteroate synthase
MGVLNVTPDSFSDGGLHVDPDRAVAHALTMIEEGADFIDIGGESTRPGSDPVPAEEELRRVLPVIRELAKRTDAPLSIDTYKSEVAEAALDAGAVIVNDISAMTMDARMAEVVARRRASVVLMHMRGTPKTMQANPHYDDVVAEVKLFLRQQVEHAQRVGIEQIIIDPGIGFGKTLEHNLTLMRELHAFNELGFPVLVGPSRKSFIGTILNLPVEKRLEGTAAAVAACVLRGAHIVRVHDVQAMKRVARVADALRSV